jgi:hypothetical protein
MPTPSRLASLIAIAGLAASASGQTDILWNAGSGNWSAAANWDPMDVPNATTENALILGPAFINVTVDGAFSINDLEVGPMVTLTLDPIRALTLAGDMVNDGLIVLNPSVSANNAFVQFNSDAAMTGSGVLRLAGGGDDAQLVTNAVVLTNSLGHTIDGAGSILANLVNDGIVSAIDTGFGNQLRLISTNKTNNLTMQAGPGAILEISSITITQGAAGTITANAGGEVLFTGNPTVVGGTLVGPGAFSRPSGNLSLVGTAIDCDIEVEPFGGVIFSGAAFDLTGTITLNDSTSGNNAFLQFNTDSVADGGGTVFLAGGEEDSQLVTNSTVLTLAPGFTVEGSGSILANIVNNGLVRAFPSANGNGRLRLISTNKTNNAEILADAGGVIEISGITITQGASGELLADGGVVEFNGSQTVTGGTIRTANGGALARLGNGNLSLVNTVLDADLPVAASGGVVYSGGVFDCSGVVTLNDSNSSNNAFLQFNTDSTATGGGSVFLAGSADDSQLITNATVLTIADDFSVGGSGQVLANFVNNGLVRAFPSDNGNGRLILLSTNKINNALVTAEAGGVLEINGVTVTQGPDGVILADGGEVEFNATQTISGGTVRAQNGGTLDRVGNGNLSFIGVALEGDLLLNPPSGLLYSGDDFVCTGAVVINDTTSGNNSFLQFNTDTLATGGGRFFLGGSAEDSQLITNATVLTIAPDFTVEGSGHVLANFVNNGLVRAFPSANGDGRLRLISTNKTNNAEILADAGGVVEINGITVTQSPAGQIHADGGIVELAASSGVTGGTLATSNGGRLVQTPSSSVNLSGITLEGDLELQPPSTTFYNSSDFVNNASVIINDTGSGNNSVLQFNASTTITGAGSIVLAGGADDSRMVTNSTVVTFGVDQVVEGTGDLIGSFVFDGTLSPGLSVGVITGSGSLSLNAPALLDIEAAGDPGNNDLVNRSGSVALGGTLRFRFLDGFTPTVFPAVYTVATAQTITGDFDALDLPPPIQPGTAVYVDATSTNVFVAFTCKADNAAPFGILDLADISGFVSAFLAQEPVADLAEPFGIFDLLDLTAFVQGFTLGCN